MARRGCFVPMAHAQAQRCIVKGSMTYFGREYLTYMTREGRGLDGQEPTLYGNVTREQFVEHASSRYFVWIVSPEHGQQVDMVTFTKDLMERVTNDLRLDHAAWIAATHYNTAHPHSHIILHGRQLHGQSFEIDNEYLRNGMKNEARDLLSQELGPQHNFDWDYERTLALERDFVHELQHERFVERLRQWQREQELFLERTHTLRETQERANALRHPHDRTFERDNTLTRPRERTRESEREHDRDYGFSR